MPELSIIVPVYKVEQYLPKCIDSILAQTFSDFELILIDDGSPDRCGRICDEYAAKDSRINVIHQENRGVSAARNAGLELARGEYIGFVDSDDWIEPEMYETMITTAADKGVDVVICGFRSVDENGIILQTEACEEFFFCDNLALFSELFGMPIRIGGGCWNKLFRRDIVEGNRFLRNIKMKEDGLFVFDCFANCRRGYVLSQVFYNYFQGTDSATRRDLVAALFDTVPGEKLLYQKAKQFSREVEGLAINKILDDLIRYSKQIKRAGYKGRTRQYFGLVSYIFKLIIIARIKNLVPKAKIHGHLYNFLRQ